MRRKDREITDFGEMLKIMETCDVCRIGLYDPDTGYPYIVPLNFGYDHANGHLALFFHGAGAGRKHELIERCGGAASFEMDTGHTLITGDRACDYSYKYSSVMGTGRIERLEAYEDKVYGLGRIMEHYAGEAAHSLSMNETLIKRTCVLKFSVTDWTCKRH